MKKLHLNENFDNVQVDAQAVASVPFVVANKEHDENKKRYEDALKNNVKEAEGTVPEEGSTGKKVTSKVLKKMHLSEALFDEEEIDEAIGGKNLWQRIAPLLDESLEENSKFDFDSDVYNAIMDICFDYRNKGLSKTDVETALEWFLLHYYTDDNSDYILDESLNEARDRRGMQERLVSYLEKFMKAFKINYESMGEALMSIGKSFKTLSPMTESLNESAPEDKKKDYEILCQMKSLLDNTSELISASVYSDIDSAINGAKDYLKNDVYIDTEVNESLEEIDRKVFKSLNRETKEPGVYYVLNDGNFERKIYADSDEDAKKQFRSKSQVNESLIYNVAKEQLNRYNEGKMGENWNPKLYVEKLVSKKYLDKAQAKSLLENVNK